MMNDLTKAMMSHSAVDTEIGIFYQVRIGQVVGRNPRTHEPIVIGAKVWPYFVPSERFLRQVFGNDAMAAQDARDLVLERITSRLDGYAFPGEVTTFPIGETEEKRIVAALSQGLEYGLDNFGRFRILNFGKKTVNFDSDDKLLESLNQAE